MKLTITICSLLFIFISCKPPEARRPLSVKSGSFINESIERNKQLAAKEEAIIQKLIKKDSIHKYLASDGGFWYYYVSRDTLASDMPKFGDIVDFNYNVKDLNKNIIYTKEEIDTINYTIDKQELFLGLREGLKLMKEGEVVTFLFPSYQAYGYYGDDDKIGTNIPLITEVYLHKITKQTSQN